MIIVLKMNDCVMFCQRRDSCELVFFCSVTVLLPDPLMFPSTKGCLSPNPDKYPSQLHPATNHVPQASRSKPAVTTSQQASTANEQTLFTSSSEGQASLQEIWKLLDEEESFRSSTPGALFPGPSPQDSVPRSQFLDHMPSESTTISSEFAVKGRQAVTELKPSAKRPGLSWKAAGKAKLTPQKPKIRNYNVRDNV